MPQGAFVKRHRLPKPDCTFYTLGDLKFGTEIDVYGKIIRIIDADKFTKKYCREDTLGQPEPMPSDNYSTVRWVKDHQADAVRNKDTAFKDYVNEEKLDPLECPEFQVKIDECKDAWKNYYNDKGVPYDGSFCMQTLPDETMAGELKGRGHCPLMHDANGKPYPANWITNDQKFPIDEAKNILSEYEENDA